MDLVTAEHVRTHLDRCKERAFRYLARGDVGQAWAAFISAIMAGPLTPHDRELLFQGTNRLLEGELTDVESMRRFIEGF